MNARSMKRMERVERVVAALPLRRDVVQKAFEHFRETGELPEEQRLAAKVVEQALRGGEPEAAQSSYVMQGSPREVERIAKLLVVAEMRSRGLVPEPERPSVRECLFDEAVYGPWFIRFGARQALKVFVGLYDGDVTDPMFLADKTLPDHAGLGLHLLGFPERLAKPPYVRQARRLFARYADLRQRIDQDDPAWFEPFEDAILAFLEHGHLPADRLLREVVLADAEFHALMRHAVGEDVGELMAALGRVHASRGSRLDEALAELVAVVSGNSTQDSTSGHA